MPKTEQSNLSPHTRCQSEQNAARLHPYTAYLNIWLPAALHAAMQLTLHQAGKQHSLGIMLGSCRQWSELVLQASP